MAIYDVQGRQVSVLDDRIRAAGHYSGRWDGRNARGNELASGVYFLHLEQGGRIDRQKVVIAR